MQCPEASCQVCQLNRRLIDKGAESVPWADLCEQGCHLYVRISIDHGCIHGLRLDKQQAVYRRISRGAVTKMCDFSVVAVLGYAAQLIVVELKSGLADAEAIDQLDQGLRVLHAVFQENGLEPRPAAYLVAGRQVDKLRFSLRDKLTSLRFGSSPVILHILECGDELPL